MQTTFHFCGYFPKRVTPLPEGYELPGVVTIASVSGCIAKGPEGWIESWAFNELGFFDDVHGAEALVPEAERSQYDAYAYEILGERFAEGVAEPWTLPSLADFFECSPLSLVERGGGLPTVLPVSAASRHNASITKLGGT